MTNNTIMRTLRRPSWVNRIIAYTTLAIMVIQNISFATAATLASTTIQYDLSNNPLFERALTGNYQYVTNTYVEQSAPASALTLTGFYTRLQNDYRPNLGEPTYIPIGIDPVTIIPVYERPRFVGSPLVQSRYVRYQVQTLLGRNLIDADTNAYATEEQQINTLYNNALWYLDHENPDAIYGQNLNLDQENSGLAKDIVWPEFRVINGEKVVVPIVYLTSATVASRKVTEHETAFNSQASFNNLTIDDVAVRFGRQAFLNVAGNLLNNQGELSGGGDLQIVVDGALNNLSGIIQATGDLRISAHSINNQTIVHRYDFGGRQGGRFGEIASINSSNGDVILRSHSDILVQGGIVDAPAGGINFAANGNIYIGPVQYTESGSSEGRGWNSSYSRTNILQSSLSAEQTIQMIAQGEIKIDAAEIVSDQGHIELLAGLGITIEDELSRSQSVNHYKFGKTTTDVSAYKTVAMRSILDAGKGVRIHSEYGDITMRAADITSSEGANVKASNGAVNLLMTVENDHYSYSSIKKSLFTIKTVNRGHDIETGVPNSIVGGLHVEALNGVNVEYEGDPELTLDEQVQVLSQFEGLEWMADVRANVPNADWTAIDLAYEEWDKTSTTLSPAALAIITIVVAVVTAGAGAAAAGAIAAQGSATYAAVAAGVNALISQVAVAVANGAVNGDIGGALEDLASSDTVKSLAIAMVTAGALSKIDAQFFEVASGEDLTLLEQSAQAVTHATVQAGVETAVAGGDFDEAFVQALGQNAINSLGQHMADKIGDAADVGDINTAVQYIAHAAAGCIVGLGSSSVSDDGIDDNTACVSGAGGAVIGEFVGELYEPELKEDLQQWSDGILRNTNTPPTLEQLSTQINVLRAKGANISKLAAGFAAFMAGADIHTSASSAYTTALFNATESLNKSTAQYYKWVDENGVVHFSDSHPAKAGVIQVTYGLGGSTEIGLDEEAQRIKEEEIARKEARAKADAKAFEIELNCRFHGIQSACDKLNTGWTTSDEPDIDVDSDTFLEGTPGKAGLIAALNTLEQTGELVEDASVLGCNLHNVCSVAVEMSKVIDGETTFWSAVLVVSGVKGTAQLRRTNETYDVTKKLPGPLRNKMKRIINQTAAGGDNGVTGSVSHQDAMKLGEAFVGPGYRMMSNKKGYVSEDGLRIFRFPESKTGINPNTLEPWSRTGRQANFETKAAPGEVPVSNVHLDVD